MKLRAIRTDADLDWALSEIEQYFDTPPAPGTEDADRFDILTDLIEGHKLASSQGCSSHDVGNGMIVTSHDISIWFFASPDTFHPVAHVGRGHIIGTGIGACFNFDRLSQSHVRKEIFLHSHPSGLVLTKTAIG